MEKLILVSGKMQSGKNTFSELLGTELSEHYKVEFDLFARSLKDGVRDDFKALHEFIREQYLSLPTEARIGLEWMNVKDEHFYEDKTPYSRLLLQIYGTEIFRERVDDLYWVKTVENRFLESDNEICIVTDVRFPNEIEYFRSKNYEMLVLRVTRTNRVNSFNEEHYSETALDDYSKFDSIIVNDGTLEELNVKVKQISDSIKLGERSAIL